MRPLRELLAAVQFLTRLPVPAYRFEPELATGAVKFYPVAGALIGLGAAAIELLLRNHLPAIIVSLAVLAYLVLLTGGMHEDGLADTFDGLGAGGERSRMLEIMRDSRMGSYGTMAIVFSVLSRWTLLSLIAPQRFAVWVIAAQVLCRWSSLPLAAWLPSARRDGLGVQLAGKVSAWSVVAGSAVAFGIAFMCLRGRMIAPAAVVLLITLLSGLYYRRKLGGITGDCFGASNQLAEIGVYLCAVWS
jgi:adenosylcobinamide-GDP ribazoletransferase